MHFAIRASTDQHKRVVVRSYLGVTPVVRTNNDIGTRHDVLIKPAKSRSQPNRCARLFDNDKTLRTAENRTGMGSQKKAKVYALSACVTGSKTKRMCLCVRDGLQDERRHESESACVRA